MKTNMTVELELDHEETLTSEEAKEAVAFMLNDPRWKKVAFAVHDDSEIFVQIKREIISK